MNTAGVQSGQTLTEVLVATVLLAILLVPAINAIQTGFLGAEAHADLAIEHYRLVARMETVLSEPYADIEAAAAGPTTPSSYSDAAGAANRVVVYINGYDADNADADNDPFSGVDADILWVQVALENSPQSLESLAVR